MLPFGAVGVPGFESFVEGAAVGLGVMNVPEADDGRKTPEIIPRLIAEVDYGKRFDALG